MVGLCYFDVKICFGFLFFAFETSFADHGAKIQKERKIVFLASDLRNGGVQRVMQSFQAAARELGWSLDTVDGKGDSIFLKKALNQALEKKVDGVVIGGFEVTDHSELIDDHKGVQTVLIGWHANAKPGPSHYLFSNITTDPMVVATLAAQSVKDFGAKNPGVLILSDSRFSIAEAKAKKMAEAISNCKTCTLLGIENVSISSSSKDIPILVEQFHGKYGKKWTHTLAINDVFFDHMNFPLNKLKRTDIVNISAGDGSKIAISRIRSGSSQQVMTVAEPLIEQGWQLADEFWRAFHGKKWSSHLTEPIVVTSQKLVGLGAEDLEDSDGLCKKYRTQWGLAPETAEEKNH